MAEKSVSTESFATETRQEYTGRKLRVAIIGCGGISETHIKAFQAFPDVELIAGVDVKTPAVESDGGEIWTQASVHRLEKDAQGTSNRMR